MVAEWRLNLMEWPATASVADRMQLACAYAIEPTINIRQNADLDALVAKDTGIATRNLLKRLDELNALLVQRAISATVTSDQLNQALNNVRLAAEVVHLAVDVDPGTVPLKFPY